VLAQLGLKVQHALRAFTAIDRQAIKLTAETSLFQTIIKLMKSSLPWNW